VLNDRFRELSSAERKDVRDVVYGSAYACLLIGDTLECCGKDRVSFRKDISLIKPLRFVYSDRSSLISAKVVHIAVGDGRLAALPETAEELKSSDPRTWSFKRTKYPVAALGQGAGRAEFVLTTDGQVFSVSGKPAEWSPVPAFEGRSIKTLVAPFYWSSILNDL
jgi:hypothetical protein